MYKANHKPSPWNIHVWVLAHHPCPALSCIDIFPRRFPVFSKVVPSHFTTGTPASKRASLTDFSSPI